MVWGRESVETFPGVFWLTYATLNGMDASNRTAHSECLSPREAAKWLGVSIQTLRRRLDDGSIPFIQHGGRRCRIAIPVSALSSIAFSNATPDDRSYTAHHPASEKATKLSGPAPKWLCRKAGA